MRPVPGRTLHLSHDPGDPWDCQTIDLSGFEDRGRMSRQPFPDQRFEVQERFENEGGISVT